MQEKVSSKGTNETIQTKTCDKSVTDDDLDKKIDANKDFSIRRKDATVRVRRKTKSESNDIDADEFKDIGTCIKHVS